MPNDLAVRPASAVVPVAETSGGRDAASGGVPQQLSPSDAGRPNPSLRLDAALGMVIIEFHAESGAVTTSIPTERQLQAYRIWERTGTDGTPPPGQAPHTAADPAPADDRHVAATKHA